MQAKRYARNAETTVAAGAVQNVGEITNSNNRRSNFHGIRAKGRIRADNVSADNEAHGLVLIMAINQSFSIAETDLDSDTNMQDLSEQIVATVPWSVFGGSTNPVGGGTFFDWEIEIKSSRTLTRGQELRLIVVSYAESAKSVISSQSLMSCFETVIP